jgi:hypothetical protein
MTLLYDAYKIFDERETDFNLHCGDVFDGTKMYRGHEQEVFLHNSGQQLEYGIQHYPMSKRNRKTYAIGGQHDYCFLKREGYNIIEHLCDKRKDLVYRGYFNARFKVKDFLLELQHPGGGTSYAWSYGIQKAQEGITGHVVSVARNKPDALLNLPLVIFWGHWHVAIHIPNYMGIDSVALPCFQAQTIYLQQKKLQPVIGCAIGEIWLNQAGNIASTKIEFIRMGDRLRENDY